MSAGMLRWREQEDYGDGASSRADTPVGPYWVWHPSPDNDGYLAQDVEGDVGEPEYAAEADARAACEAHFAALLAELSDYTGGRWGRI